MHPVGCVSQRVSRITKQQIGCWDVPAAGGKLVTSSSVSGILVSVLPISGKNCVECQRVRRRREGAAN